VRQCSLGRIDSLPGHLGYDAEPAPAESRDEGGRGQDAEHSGDEERPAGADQPDGTRLVNSFFAAIPAGEAPAE
jgi:hypothetical protein